LRLAFRHVDAILQIRDLCGIYFSGLGALLQKRQTATLQRWIGDCVLQNEPSRMGPFFTHQRSSRPTMLFDYALQRFGVAQMHFSHARRVTMEQLIAGYEFGADTRVLVSHVSKFALQFVIHGSIGATFARRRYNSARISGSEQLRENNAPDRHGYLPDAA
jgi:hypothetical protein